MSADDLNGPEMTGPELEGDERLAAEYAMGLLEGEDLLAARGRMANEPAFAGLVARWEQHLMALLDDVADAAPSPEVWERIAGEFEETSEEDSPVVILQRRVTLWQRIAAGSAVAAVAALALLFVPAGDAPAPGISGMMTSISSRASTSGSSMSRCVPSVPSSTIGRPAPRRRP